MFQRKFFWFIVLGLFTSVLMVTFTGCSGHSSPSVAVTAAASTVDGNDTTTLTAAVTHDQSAAGVTWTVSGGGTLSDTTTTSATYTAPAPTSSAQTATITATSVADTSKSGTATITVPAMPTVTSTSASLAGAVGSTYSITLQASGGIAPYTWALGSGTTLPTCLTLKSGGILTTTSGTAPTASCAGTYSDITFKITDSGTPTALTATSSALTVVITAPSITFSPVLPAGAVGSAYTGSVAATGPVGATTYSLASGALPPDLILNASTGAITGTPKAADVGTASFKITVQDAYGDTATSGSMSITIAAAPAIAFGGAPAATANFGVAYASSVTASGGVGSLTYSVASGALPPDLTLSASGAIAGTPKAADIGTFTFAVMASDAYGDSATSGNYSIVVSYPAVTITPGAGSLAFAVMGQAYSQTLTAVGGSGTGYTWTVAGLPANGISYTASGATLNISGPATSAGTVNFTASVTDGANNTNTGGPLAYSIQIYSPATIPATIPASLPSVATVNVAYTGTVVATGGSGNYSWTVTGLSDGLTSSSSGATLTISGTPTAAATVTANVTVKDTTTNVTSGPYAYVITVYATVTLPTSNPSTLGPAIVSTPYSGTIVAAGGSGNYSWTVTGLPADNLNESTSGGTLTISGTPGTATTVSFTAKVTDTTTNLSSGPYNYSVTVYNPVTLNASSLPATANANVAYTGTITASGGSGSGYVWTVTGLSDGLSSSASGGTLTISGTPTSAATVSFNVSVKDDAGNTSGSTNYTITVYGALSLPTSNPSSLPSGYTSVAYSGTVNASGGSGSYAWTVTGLPSDNLSSSASGGTLTVSGTPSSTPTTVSFTAKVTDTTTNASVGPYNYSIAITTPVAVSLPAPNPSSLGSATQNESYSGAINASGGVAPYTWSINGTTVTSGGLSLGNGTLTATASGGNTLTVSGTPSTSGTVTLTNVKVVDSLNSNATNTYTITVNSQTPLSLPLPSTNPLPQGTVNQAYSGAINASGGVGSNYSFTVAVGSGTAQSVPTNGTPLALTDGLSATNTGGYTLVISGTPTAAASVSLTIAVKDSANNTASETYTFNIVNPNAGYTIAGTVTYTGSDTGWVYLQLSPSSGCSDCSDTLGTAINATTSGALASGADFTIHGVPAGTYTLRAFMDNLGYGAENASNPTGSVSGITVTSSGLTGQSVTLTNPAPITLSGTPTWDPSQGSGGFNGGAVIYFDPMYNGNGIETPASYEVQYSTSSSFSGTPGSKCFPANGGNNPWVVAGLTNNSTYYFRAAGNTGACGSSTAGLTYSSASSGVAIGAPTAGSMVSGTVTWTGAAIGTLYVGCYASSTGNVYADPIANPVSPQSYSVYVPNGTNCELFGFIDQNNTGLVGGPGEISNTNNGIGMVPVTVNGTMPNENLTLPSGNSIAEVKTQTNSNGSSASYNIGFQVYGLLKLPVSVELLSETPEVSGTAADVVMPADIASGGFNGNADSFDNWPSVTGTPVVGDSYKFNVTYSDGTSEQLTAAVTGVLNAFATGLSPTGSGVSTTPNFTWTDPSPASSYVYQFQLTDSNGNRVWQIPAHHSSSNGFSSSITSITWDVDPTNTGDLPSVSSLNSSSTYNWSIAAYDSNMNEAQVQVSFQTAESSLALPASGTFNALENAAFSEGLTATGGSGSGYVFTVAVDSGTAQSVPTGGSPLALTDGLSAISSGDTLTISGTPTAVEAVTLNVSVTDSASHSAGPVTYTINVVSAPNGVNNGNLKGTYVCKVNGYDDNDNSEWASLSSFVLNGSGSLTSGVWDTNGQDFTAAETGTTTGTYSIGADNNGVMTTNSVITSGGTGSPSITWAVALSNATSPAQEFQMVETDDVGSSASGMHSSGVCYLASPSAFVTGTFNGGFVYSLNGTSGAGNPEASLGLINVSSGTLNSGYADSLKIGTTTDSPSTLTGGGFSTPDTTYGRSTMTGTSTSGNGTFAVYIIDANRMFILMTGAVEKAQSGDMRKQQQTSYSAANFDGAAVLYSQAYQYQNSAYSYYSSVYQVSGNGAGGLTVNQSYNDNAGTYGVGNEKGGTATVTFDTSNPGRATFSPGSDTAYLYFFNNNSALYVDFNGSEGWLESGWLEPQSQTTFTDAAVAGNYMFGAMPVVMEPTTSVPIGEFDLLSNGTYTDEVTLGGKGSFTFDQPGSGTYSWDTSATGTGSFLEGSGSNGTSCVVISSTRAACILNADNSPSVMILQQ